MTAVSSDRMYLQQEDGTIICLRAVAGVIQASTNGSTWADIQAAGGGGGGSVDSVVAGAGIAVDATDPANPIVSASGTSWYDTEAAFHASFSALLTESVAMTIEDIKATGGANVQAAAPDIEGGAIMSVSSASFRFVTPAAIWKAMNSSKIGLSVQGALGAVEVAKSSHFALAEINGKSIRIGTIQSVSATNVLAYTFDGSAISATVDMGAYDGNVHTWRIMSDGTTISFYKDGVLKGTILTAAAHVPSQAGYVAIQDNVTSSAQAITKVLYSYAYGA